MGTFTAPATTTTTETERVMQILKDADADLSLIRGRTVALIGYGNQGRAHAANLRDSGVRVIVASRGEGASGDRARDDGFDVRPIADAVHAADVVMLLAPDEHHGALYTRAIAPAIRPGTTLAFGHGFSVRFGTVHPAPELDVILVAPVGPGHQLRSRYREGAGIPGLIAVHQDPTGTARALAISYAAAIGCGRAGILPTTFRDECETDLFGEQAVIVGGVARLITAGFETLVEAGYPEELAYFECAHQMKLLTDLIHERGIAGMRGAISSTARYGDLTRGPRIVGASAKAEMKRALEEIQSGAFAGEWIAEHHAGRPHLTALTRAAEEHPIEHVGRRLRALTAAPGRAPTSGGDEGE